MKRRDFLRHSALTGVSVITAPTLLTSFSQKNALGQSPNDRIGVGVIGAGGMGTGDAHSAARFGEIVAVADADLRHATAMKAAFSGKPEIYQDYRKLLERQDVDVIIQATPDHWHTKINIDAARAGKDIYGEKPITFTVREGQQLCRVLKETGRIFQTGTQQRSERPFQTAVELVRNGRIGNLKRVLVALPYFNTVGGPFPTMDPPAELDWELYQGQAPVCPYMPQKTHAIFRWWYEYAGGIVTDWGNHHMDIAFWGMDMERSGPLTVESRAIFPNDGKTDCFNTPDRFFSAMKFPGGLELFFFATLHEKLLYGVDAPHSETTREQVEWMFGKGCPDEVLNLERNGIMFLGEKGRVFVNRGGVYGKPVEELSENPLPEDAWKVRPSDDHMKNFFDCVRSRETPVAPAEIEHRVITACHLTNISLRLGGRPLQWNSEQEIIVGDEEANAMLQRDQREPYQTI